MDYRQNLDLVAPHILRKFGQASLALVLAAYAGFITSKFCQLQFPPNSMAQL